MRAATATGGRRRTRPALVLAVAIVTAACGGGNTGGGGGGQRVRDPNGVLRYAYDLETGLTNLDPALSGNTCDKVIWSFIYDSLLRLDDRGNLAPGLAREFSLEGRTITLKLQRRVTYHDGTPFDAESVKQGLEYNDQNVNLTSLDLVDSIEVVDDLTLKIHLDSDQGNSLLYALTGQDGMLVAPSAFSEAGEHPVGAGPFVFDSFTPGSTLRLKAFPDYFQKDRWKLGGIEFVQVGFGPPNVTAYQSGDVDLIRFLAESYPVVEKLADTEISTTASGQYAQLEFRLRKGPDGEETPFADKRVRQAVNYAINRDELNRVVEGGRGEVAWQQFNTSSPFHVPELDGTYTYDPDKARDLLAQAGYPDGFEFEMVIPGGNITNMERQAEIIQSQLAEVGVKAAIKRILPGDIPNEYYLKKEGDAFAAQELAVTFAPAMLDGQFGDFEFVAIHDGAERGDITDLMDMAFAAPTTEGMTEYVRQGVQLAVEEALDVPLYFAPQYAAWNTERVGGHPVAPTDSCAATDLRGVYMTK